MKFYKVDYKAEQVTMLDGETHTRSIPNEFKRFELLSDDLFENNHAVLQELCQKIFGVDLMFATVVTEKDTPDHQLCWLEYCIEDGMNSMIRKSLMVVGKGK